MKICLHCQILKDDSDYGIKKDGTVKKWCYDCCREAKGRAKDIKAIRREHGIGKTYESRDYYLQLIGFNSYRDYLASDLWKKVRQKVFAIKGRKCHLCGAEATALHHHRYYLNELLGRRRGLKFIDPICGECHESIEFDGGRKANMKNVRRAFVKKKRKFTSKRRR